MDTSKINQKEIDYNLNEGTLLLNLVNKQVSYYYPVSSIGMSTFQINLSLIYNSKYLLTDFNNIKIGIGNGWKFNIEEYVFEYKSIYNIEGFNTSDYVYIDSGWKTHRFVRYRTPDEFDNDGYLYYDESGTGLKLIVKENSNYEIIDQDKNKLIFDKDSKRLIQVISGVNENIIKKIKYDNNDLLREIYDERKQTRKIIINYNEDDLPVKVITTDSNTRKVIEYENKMIKQISKENDVTKTVLQNFIYTNNVLTEVRDIEKEENIKIEYNNESIKIIEGVFRYKVKPKEQDMYLTSSYVKESYYLKQEHVVDCLEILTTKKSEDKIIYNTSYTDIIDEKGIKIRCYFDTSGNVLNAFLVDEDEKLITLSKEEGIEISVNGNSNIFINNKKTKQVVRHNNIYNVSIDNNELNTFKNKYKDDSQTFTYFNLSFYLMFKDQETKRKIIKIKYKLNDEEKEEQAVIKNTNGQAFQKIIVPLYLDSFLQTLSDLRIVIEDSVGNNSTMYISNLMIDKGSKSVICIESTKYNDASFIELKMGSKIYVYEDSEKEITISPDFYFTSQDIILTYKSIYESIQNNSYLYDLHYCNNTKLKRVGYVSMESYYSSDGLNTNWKYSVFGFDKYDKNDERIKTSIPNYHIRTIDLVIHNEKEKLYRVSEVKNNIEYTSNKYYYITNTKVKIIKLDDIVTRLNDDSIYMKVKRDETGKVLKQEYQKGNEKVYNEYIYDSYSNLVKEITSVSSSNEQIVKEYKYTEETEKEREYIEEITSEGNVIKYLYNSNGLVNTVIRSVNRKYDNEVYNINQVINKEVYKYDSFDNLISIEFYDNNNKLIKTNNISYNKKGDINGLSDNYNKYGFLYNSFNDLCEIYHNKVLLQKNLKESIDNKDVYTSCIYNKDNTNYKQVYNKYGRIESSSVNEGSNNKEISYEYESSYSELVERIKKIIDPFTNQTYEYEYIDDVREETTVTTRTNDLTITEYQNNMKVYDIKEDKIFVSFTKDENNNLISYQNIKANEKPNTSLFTYSYDEFNRLKEVLEFSNNSYIKDEITYYPLTSLPKNIKYNIGDKTILYTNSYLNNNIIKVKEGSKETNYEYDSMNRLVKENDYSYKYNTHQFLETIECNNKEIRRFEYTDNKLTKVIENDKIINIEYDRYGNIIKLGNSNIKYNKRLLMESYDDITYEYNYQGIRTKKTKANEYEIKYYLDYDKIIEEEKKDLKTNEITRLIYYYEARGIRGISYKKNEEERYYSLIKDSLNNISKVINKGKIVGEYKYNAWGEIEVEIKEISDEVDRYVINNNPFRYKGYYYDKEISLYYCINRYYSKELCQWISPDSIEYIDIENINGLNLYCYCYNNPVNYYDPSGNIAISIIILLVCIGIGALVGGTYAGVTAYNNGARDWELVGWTALGAFLGGVVGGTFGYYAGPIAASLLSAGEISFAGIGAAGLTMSGAMAANIVVAGAISGTSVVTALGLVGITVMGVRIGKSGGYRIDHHYPNDHAPAHVHISGDDGVTRVDINGNPIQGDRQMTPGEKKAFWRLIEKIIEALKPWM